MARGVHEYYAELVKELLPEGSSLLDVGSGSGALAARLADSGYDVIASDLDLDGSEAPVHVKRWDAGDTSAPPPVPAASVGGVCYIEVLEHVENPIVALRNLQSLLRPNGYLIMSTPNVGHIRSRLKFLLTGAPSYFGVGEYHGSGHRTILPDWLLILHAESINLEIANLSYAGGADTSRLQAFFLPLLQWIGKVFLGIARPADQVARRSEK